MTYNQLVRLRWGVRGALALGVATSVAANVLHAEPNPISQAIAAWPPLALLLTVELISRVPVHRRGLAVVRMAATALIAGIAAWVSYWHMAGVAARYGEDGAAPYLIPISVDGLVVVASVCLVELSGRIQAATAPLPEAASPPEESPAPAPEKTDTTTDTSPDIGTAFAPDAGEEPQPETVGDSDDESPDTAHRPEPAVVRKPKRKRDTASAVARLRERHPDMSAVEIARRVGVTDRTVRRHLRTPVIEAA
ncbi:DUF2637 domain-containing protein [Catenuloplanes atrovinosus]|uniref:DUF2637 domain-containing protein n=1 Tax=Catenuloplanes atrovinosus TaxID=137266 RepID=A0AAE3YU20_9ACTN|nr:DUF2637 domain-containing protein [Catenuloplanes atrovinosus]MDR7278394.1 hypothetical protein [Catenuloplanes atrovinosus]